MNGNCYFSEGVNPTLTCNKNEGNRVAIPIGIIDDQGRTTKRCDVKDTAPTLRSQTHGNEPKVAIPVLTPDRANKRQNGRRFKEDGEESFTLTAQDRHGVAVEVTGYNATLKRGGGRDGHDTGVMRERLQRTVGEQSDDDNRSSVFAIDKGITPKEREVANCIRAREDSGLSKYNQQGTLICHKIT